MQLQVLDAQDLRARNFRLAGCLQSSINAGGFHRANPEFFAPRKVATFYKEGALEKKQ